MSEKLNSIINQIEWSIDVAKELGVKTYTIEKENYKIKVTIK